VLEPNQPLRVLAEEAVDRALPLADPHPPQPDATNRLRVTSGKAPGLHFHPAPPMRAIGASPGCQILLVSLDLLLQLGYCSLVVCYPAIMAETTKKARGILSLAFIIPSQSLSPTRLDHLPWAATPDAP
jgi:hypothetical protein